MALEHIYSFLTYPEKNNENAEQPRGIEIEIALNKLNKMLGDAYIRAGDECNVPICFTSNGEVQENSVRNELLNFIATPSLDTAQPLANRLQSVTTHTSGMGLLFLCVGTEDEFTKVLISRYPADEGVVADAGSEELTVQFVDQVFLKSAYSYKAAVFRDASQHGFWEGSAVDKQLNHGAKNIADYWIVDFLNADLRETSASGTKRLAAALKAAVNAANDVTIKDKLIACVQLAANLPDRAMTIPEFCDAFHIGDEAKDLICAQVKPARVLNEKFRFSSDEFAKHVSFKSIQLDNGAMLSAEVSRFGECFYQTQSDDGITFTTTGNVVNEVLKRTLN